MAVAGALLTFRPPRVGAVTIETPRISAVGTIALFTECGFCKKSWGPPLGNRPAQIESRQPSCGPGAIDIDAPGPGARHDQASWQPARLRRAAGVLPRPRTVSANRRRDRSDRSSRRSHGSSPSRLPLTLRRAWRGGPRNGTVPKSAPWLGFREATVADAERCSKLGCEIRWRPSGRFRISSPRFLRTRCRELSIEPPAADRIDRIVRAAIHAHDERFCAGILGRLVPADTRTAGSAAASGRERVREIRRPISRRAPAPALLLRLRGDPGKPSLASVQDELAKLELIRRDRAACRPVRRRASP